MIIIKARPYTYTEDGEQEDFQKPFEIFRAVSWEEVTRYLVVAINEDVIDTTNNELMISIE